jgi:hypothetical protein
MKLILEVSSGNEIDVTTNYYSFEGEDITSCQLEILELAEKVKKNCEEYFCKVLTDNTPESIELLRHPPEYTFVYKGHTFYYTDFVEYSYTTRKACLADPVIYTLEEFWEKNLP